MTNVPFLVICASCESLIEVRNPELVGQIVACPNCGSMVLIEPTSQSRERLQTSDFRLQERAPNTVPEARSPKPDAIADPEARSPKPEATFDIDNQFSSVAEELQTKFLSDAAHDDWQKRRLVIVAVGTFCLLTVFTVFLLFRLQASGLRQHEPTISVADSEARSSAPEAFPPIPDGIVATQTGGHQDNPPPVDTPSVEGEQVDSTPFPLIDEIKVEGQPDLDDIQPDATDTEAETPSSGPLRPPRSLIDSIQPGGGIRVTPPIVEPSDEPSVDPFDDFDGMDATDLSTDQTENAPGGYGTVSGDTIEPSTSEADGFSDMFDDDDEIESTETTDAAETETTEPDDDLVITQSDLSVDAKAPEIADINERLAKAVTSIRFEKTPVIVVVRTMSELSGVPMQLDVDELRARGISVEAPVSLQLQETTIAGIMDAVLEKTRLARLTQHDGNGCLVFGYTDEQMNALRTARYDMSRLASLEQDPISAESAAKWLTTLLVNQPQNPRTTNAAVAVDGNEIVVIGTIWLQDQAKRLLLSLFYLRDLEPENVMPPERLAPEVFGWDRVNVPLSFTLLEPIPLREAARRIEEHTRMRVLIDHAALHAEGFSQDTPVESRVSHGTVDTVLSGMLEPLELTYRIVEANVVEITTPQAACDKMTIEAQQCPPPTDEKTPESYAEAMQQTFGGVIVIDPVSGYMLVRQSQPTQRDIRQRLGNMHAKASEDGSGTSPR